MPKKQPRPLGRYELLRRIGAGGMGEVWLSRIPGMPGIEKVCVVKTILPHLASDRQFVGRFLDEAKVVVHLNHGNIAQVFEMGNVDGQYFMAMEFVEGKTLGRITARLRELGETFPLGIALSIGMKMCDGLAYAHRKTDPSGKPLKVVHRDVSPANVIISYQGELKIIDFGASLHTEKEEKTAPRVVIGNLAYMSPEQARKHPVDYRADVFSTGVVLWELIAWQPLPSGGDYVERWRRAAYPKFEKPSVFQPSVPPDVDDVIMRALQVNPKDRPQTADELRDQLSTCLAKIDPQVSQSSLSAFVLKLFSHEAERERAIVAEALSGKLDDGTNPDPPWAEADSLNSSGKDDSPVTDVAAVGEPGRSSESIPEAPSSGVRGGLSALGDRKPPGAGERTDPDRTLASESELLALADKLMKARAQTHGERPAVKISSGESIPSGSETIPMSAGSEATATPRVAYSTSPFMSSEAKVIADSGMPDVPTNAWRPQGVEALRAGTPAPKKFALEPSVSASSSGGAKTRYYPSPRNLTLLLGAAVFIAAVLLGFLIVAAAASDSDALPAQQEAPAASKK
jgi:serine/threonine protein kinase